MRTIFPKINNIERKWLLIDAEGKALGRLASEIASILKGKNKAEYTPNLEMGDYVVVINASKVYLSGKKRNVKLYYRHTGYPGGIKNEVFSKLINRIPQRPLELAIKGMLPKNRLGRKLFKNVKIYSNRNHPHISQKLEVYKIKE